MKVAPKESAIHGQGLYALDAIEAGEVVVWWNKREIGEAEYAALGPAELNYIDIQEGRIFLMGEPARYVNHSCEPNTEPGAGCDLATRNINAGEEITTDYRYFYIPGGEFRCSCGSRVCRGRITGKSAL